MQLPKVIPPGSYELLQELEKLNPPRCIAPDEDLNAHLRYAGVVELLQGIRAKLDAAERRAREQRSP